MIRNPAVAGQFYPGWARELRETIKYMTDSKAEKVDAIGVVVPHAGYIYSGQVAGAVLSGIEFKDTFVLMGPNHRGMGKPLSIMTAGTWKTPLGEVQVNSELANAILKESSHLEEDELAHIMEHSLEVQVPFLQFFQPTVRIVPIVFSPVNIEVYHEIGRSVARAIQKTGAGAVMLASTDMTHYEPHDSAKRKDKFAIDAILKLDSEALVQSIKQHGISMCGYAPTISLIAAAREMGAQKTKLVKYQTSGDTSGDYSSVVGYAGIIIEK